MNRDIEILQKMAEDAAEATGRFAKALDYVKGGAGKAWDHVKNNRYTYGGAGIGALAGGAGAAFATKNKKNRIRNAILGALGGGAAGAGLGYGGVKGYEYWKNRKNVPNEDPGASSVLEGLLKDKGLGRQYERAGPTIENAKKL